MSGPRLAEESGEEQVNSPPPYAARLEPSSRGGTLTVTQPNLDNNSGSTLGILYFEKWTDSTLICNNNKGIN